KELCFCILTANFNAEKCIKIQNEVGDGFLYLPERKLAETLKKLGHRYPYVRARYIVEARMYKDKLKSIIRFFENDEEELRNWLVKNVKGIGYKEASHFLRNIGYTNFAILDFHIINILEEYGIIKKPKTLTKKEYLRIENVMRKIAKKLNLNLAELDLYLWYIETKKILK
ncbi:MAG: N-glycosylase/DNA lyase, partial [Candidatus Bathyarchaeota archaeon]|nr:N-glycosylase/DNA lyase [Candidatus Bathyarchaeota archaeon]